MIPSTYIKIPLIDIIFNFKLRNIIDQHQIVYPDQPYYLPNHYKTEVLILITGIVLITCGLLIAFFPHLLSFIVASVLFLIGLVTMKIAYNFRRRGADVISYIIRH